MLVSLKLLHLYDGVVFRTAKDVRRKNPWKMYNVYIGIKVLPKLFSYAFSFLAGLILLVKVIIIRNYKSVKGH